MATGYIVPDGAAGDLATLETAIEAELNITSAEIIGIGNGSPSGAEAVNHGLCGLYVVATATTDIDNAEAAVSPTMANMPGTTHAS